MLQAKQTIDKARPETLLERAVKRRMTALRDAEAGRSDQSDLAKDDNRTGWTPPRFARPR